MSNEKEQQLEALIAHQRETPDAIEPSDDLWQGIEQRLEGQTTEDSRTWWAAAGGALAASLLAVAVFVGYQGAQPGEDIRTNESPYYAAAAQMISTQAQQVSALQRGYKLAGIEQSDEQLTTQLQQLAKARQSVLEALASGPGNAQQLELLRWINEQELALLEQSYQQKPVLKQI
ncbi:MAG TPA: hypothetical protein DCR58_04580 [Idiomarina baltica]|uniref:Uncharacterized protein n=1 Tax=Idiomarina baltica TaxID=190892 RepID=A0A348WND5_9GAMM|nr:hypothetical protein [Idiomarina baltica]MBL73665.1 hypothetical protein [Idiomarinaceae bacterium]HAE89826.1 hypothetical protein [Idiomarina sp.]HAR56047.1 hypothetical protein [Idiomarina baltica]|tara:strand:+ start:609 stop:1133 length:525 start_codon:yes stop_codon:yes gene_type:complete